MTHKIAWQVSLSNGYTFTEGKGESFTEVEGGNSPWIQLLEYLQKNSLQITSLVLVSEDNRHFCLPNSSNNPKFRRFDMAEKPIGYRCERIIGQNRNMRGEIEGKKDWFTIAVAEYPHYELQLWVDENDTRNCWTLVVAKEHNKSV